MSELMSLPHVKTSPLLFGVKVEWRWPEGSHWHSRLELQYLSADGQLKKELIHWPVKHLCIGGLKAGERLQIRLRMVGKDGSASDWHCHNWIEGVSSTNAGDYLGNVWANLLAGANEDGSKPLSVMKLAGEIPSQQVIANMTVKKSSVRSLAEETKLRLSDDMLEAVRDAVREMPAKQVTAGMHDSQVKDNDPVISTLAAVLAKVLPSTSPDNAAVVAKQMAEAVKAGFGAMRPADASQS